MRYSMVQSTGGPQIAHKLFRTSSTDLVDKLFITSMLLTCNDPSWPHLRMYVLPFLPTMKFQLLQLPLLVGSGRVSRRRALFSCLSRSAFEAIQVLKRSR